MRRDSARLPHAATALAIYPFFFGGFLARSAPMRLAIRLADFGNGRLLWRGQCVLLASWSQGCACILVSMRRRSSSIGPSA